MKNLAAFLANLWSTIVTWISRPPAPTAPSADVLTTLVQLILSQSESLGPMPGTGGVIHAVSQSTAETVAALIVKYAVVYKLAISLITSAIRAESDYDPNAIDPNDQDAKPGETAEEAAMHADVGLAQEDVSTAMGDPANRGLSVAAIEAKLYDPEYAIVFLCSTISENLAWAKAAFVADPSLAALVPNGDYRVLGMQAYNLGQRGAITAARDSGLKANWTYGLSIVKRADGWAPLLDIA